MTQYTNTNTRKLRAHKAEAQQLKHLWLACALVIACSLPPKWIKSIAFNIQTMIDNHTDTNVTLCTDEATIYKGIEGYKQLMVNHSAGEYVNGIVHTNGIESVWALLKRGYHGVFHHFFR